MLSRRTAVCILVTIGLAAVVGGEYWDRQRQHRALQREVERLERQRVDGILKAREAHGQDLRDEVRLRLMHGDDPATVKVWADAESDRLSAEAEAADVQVRWKPFQLNPTMPKDGIDRREYRTRKFGSWEHSQAMNARLAAVGRSEGLDFRFDRMARTPNTLDAHRLIWTAGRLGKQDAIVEALFRAYFAEGVDIGKREELCTLAASAGIPAAFAERLLVSDEGLPEVLAEEQVYKGLGVEGVPAFVIGGSIAFSGAIAPEAMVLALRQSTARNLR